MKFISTQLYICSIEEMAESSYVAYFSEIQSECFSPGGSRMSKLRRNDVPHIFLGEKRDPTDRHQRSGSCRVATIRFKRIIGADLIRQKDGGGGSEPDSISTA